MTNNTKQILFTFNNETVSSHTHKGKIFLQREANTPPINISFDSTSLLTFGQYDLISRFASIQNKSNMEEFINESGFIFKLSQSDYAFSYDDILPFAQHLNIIVKLYFELGKQKPDYSKIYFLSMFLLFSQKASINIDELTYYTSKYPFKDYFEARIHNLTSKYQQTTSNKNDAYIYINHILETNDTTNGPCPHKYKEAMEFWETLLKTKKLNYEDLQYNTYCIEDYPSFEFSSQTGSNIIKYATMILEDEMNVYLKKIHPSISPTNMTCDIIIPDLYTCFFYALTFINPFAYELVNCSNTRFNHFFIRRKPINTPDNEDKQRLKINCCTRCANAVAKANSRLRLKQKTT